MKIVNKNATCKKKMQKYSKKFRFRLILVAHSPHLVSSNVEINKPRSKFFYINFFVYLNP